MKRENIAKVNSILSRVEALESRIKSWEKSTKFTDTQVKTDGARSVNLEEDVPEEFFFMAKAMALKKLNEKVKVLLEEIEKL